MSDIKIAALYVLSAAGAAFQLSQLTWLATEPPPVQAIHWVMGVILVVGTWRGIALFRRAGRAERDARDAL